MRRAMDLSGQRALVTGASRGIGRAVAVRLAELGARVAVHYGSRRELADEVVAALPGAGHLAVGADLADPDSAEGLIAAAADGLGGLDVLVNNAGVYLLHPPTGAWDEWRQAWERTLAVNLVSPAHLDFFAARRMIAGGGGRIVHLSSRGAFRGEPEAPAYGASKAGLNALSQSLARALAPHGIQVTTVAPGWVATDMAGEHLAEQGEAIRAQSPLGRVASPEEIAEVVAFCAAPGGEYLTGAVIDVNGASYLR